MPNLALKELQKDKIRPVYFLYGEEPFKIQEYILKMAEILSSPDSSCPIQKLDASTLTGDDVVNELQSLDLFSFKPQSSNKKILLVRQAHLLKEVDVLAKKIMEAEATDPWSGTVLVLVADSIDGRRKFHQWLKKQGYALEFKPARDAELMGWIDYIAKKFDLKIKPDAAQMLAVYSDGVLNRLASEIEKVWLFSGAQAGLEASLNEVSQVVSREISHEMIELVTAVLEQKKAKALLLVDRLIVSQEEALGFVGFLTWALKNPERVIKSSVNRPSAQLDATMKTVQALLELDLDLKNSGLDAQNLVTEFVL